MSTQIQETAEGKKTITGTNDVISADRMDEALQGPSKYEITEEDVFTVDFAIKKVEGRWIIVNSPSSREKGVEKHWMKFRMWTFGEEMDLRKRATSYDPVKRIHTVDNDLLNRMKVQKLLKEWSFDRDVPRLKLLHVNGLLSDESWNNFIKLHTNIVRYVLEQMNVVLEYNG